MVPPICNVDATALGGRKIFLKMVVSTQVSKVQNMCIHSFHCVLLLNVTLPCSFLNKRHPGLVSAAGPLLTLPQSCKGPCSRLGHAPCYHYGFGKSFVKEFQCSKKKVQYMKVGEKKTKCKCECSGNLIQIMSTS